MDRYARLKEIGFAVDTEDDELFEVGDVSMNFAEKDADGELVLGHSSEVECAQEQESIRNHICTVPSTEILHSTKLQYSKGCRDKCRARQSQQQEEQQQDEQQNIENGNPNIRLQDPTTQPAVAAICLHSSTASGVSLQEGRGVRTGASVSGRWVGRITGERSGRCQAVGCESYHHRDNATSINSLSRRAVPIRSISSTGPSWRPSCSQRTPSIQQGTSYRDREPLLDRQSQETSPCRAGAQSQYLQPQGKESCTLYSSFGDGRHCQRFSAESSPQEGLFDDSITGRGKKTLPLAMQPTSDASYGSCLRQEKNSFLQRSNSARAAPGLPKWGSTTRDTPGHLSEISIENWRDHAASRIAHDTKHRVSFSLTENHELETKKLREKWREPMSHSKKVLQAKQDTDQQPLRYNYDQPGFVESEKENFCSGKSFTIYGGKEGKECTKGSTGRHHQVARTFSLRENNSNYSKIPRAYSVKSGGGRHVMPMECDTCGRGGIGFVFLGLSGTDASLCKACQSGSGWSCSDDIPPKKKKSIMEYCWKLLRLPKKSR